MTLTPGENDAENNIFLCSQVCYYKKFQSLCVKEEDNLGIDEKRRKQGFSIVLESNGISLFDHLNY